MAEKTSGGKFKGLEEFIILKDSVVSYKNQIKIIKNGKIDYNKSSFFILDIPDTLNLGKNIGKINYFSSLPSQKKYLSTVIENQYSDQLIKKDTFSELPNSTGIGIYAHRTGVKKITGEIIEKLIDTINIGNDSLSLSIVEYRKYFEKEVFVKDSI